MYDFCDFRQSISIISIKNWNIMFSTNLNRFTIYYRSDSYPDPAARNWVLYPPGYISLIFWIFIYGLYLYPVYRKSSSKLENLVFGQIMLPALVLSRPYPRDHNLQPLFDLVSHPLQK